MRFALAATFFGLIMLATVSSASAWQCMARSTNGAVGVGSSLILERAQKFAIQRCGCDANRRIIKNEPEFFFAATVGRTDFIYQTMPSTGVSWQICVTQANLFELLQQYRMNHETVPPITMVSTVYNTVNSHRT